MKRLIIGILAHVDAGKTTLSEAMLFSAGEIRQLGRVDHQNAFLDTHALERSRGITIFSKQALLRLPDVEITLMDTPGHVDFSPEMERALQVLDYAVLVISGPEGVQSHTETLWRLLQQYGVPTFVFLNKMDLAGGDRASILGEIQARLSGNCVDFSLPPRELFETLALCGEGLMQSYLDHGRIDDGEIAAAVACREVFPCIFGAARHLTGVDELLFALSRYTKSPAPAPEFGAVVFKIGMDDQGNRLTYVKITGGRLLVKSLLTSREDSRLVWSEKVDQIRLYSGAKFQPLNEALPGMAVAVTGLSHTYPGEGLGAQPSCPQPKLEPVLTYRLLLPEGADPFAVLPKLKQMEEEEPALHIKWDEKRRQITISLMGEVQLTVMQSLIMERLGLAVTFSEGEILYKETIAAPVEGMGHYEPLRHYAEVRLLLEPGEPGSGLRFFTDCREEMLSRNWQRLVLTHLGEKAHRGVLTGSPITDMRITLIGGRAHQKHTEGGDFREATYRAVRQGLRSGKSVLLEPWYEFRLAVPKEAVGRAMADLTRMEASFGLPEAVNGLSLLNGAAPVSEIRNYSAEIMAYTHGQGRLSLSPGGYRPCHNPEAVIARMGYDCDADVMNPADSIFIEHGAGYLVKWGEVWKHMHTPSPRQPHAQAEAAFQAQAASYAARLVEDAELRRIFERTYGPIKERPLDPFRPRAPRSAERERPVPPMVPVDPVYLLVDGYNIIFAWEHLSGLARENLDAAREKLIHELANYQGFTQCELILVFDAYKVKGNPGQVERVHGIHVVYTKEAETADMYIERVTHELGRKYQVRVATSDRLEQLIILGHGATRVSAAAFLEEVRLVEAGIRAFLAEE